MKIHKRSSIVILIITILSISCTTNHEVDGELILYHKLDLFAEKLSIEYQNQYDSSDNNDIIDEIDDVYVFIDEIMKELVRSINVDCEYISGLKYDDLSNSKIVEELMLGNNKNGLAYELSSKFSNLESIIEKKSSVEIASYILDTNDPPVFGNMEESTWEENAFLGLPLITSMNYLRLKQIQLLNLKFMLSSCK